MKKQFINFIDYMARLYPETATANPGADDYIKNKRLSRTFTFQVTDNCNLACTYCYQINKGKRKMSFETAKKAVDALLSGEKGFKEYINPQNSPGLVLEFIGGEPFLEIDLIDEIVDYFREKAIEMEHPWADKFMISICSNGVLYRDPKVQKFIQKNEKILSFSVTVDGTKKLHDTCRVFPDGRPSYDLAHDAAMDWMKRGYYMGSKITISPDNITYLSDSLKQMVKDGYYDINANCVYEKGWKPEHATELYKQSVDFIDYFLKNYNYKDFAISLFDERFAQPKSENDLTNWCGGVGFILAIDPDGDLYPCIRYMESSLGSQRKPLKIGNIHDGLITKPCEKECINCMNSVTRRSQSTDECFYCPVASGCSWCSAYNYQETGSFDKRVTYICEMHKARCLAIVYLINNYYLMEHNNDPTIKPKDLWVPKQWAIPIIGEKEYNKLVNLTKQCGAYVNENAEMIKFTNDIEQSMKERNFEILK